MCFYKTKDKQTHSISNKDIVCFKIVAENKNIIGDERFLSEYQDFKYVIGETYTENSIDLEGLDNSRMLYGGVFHSYMKRHLTRDQIAFCTWYNILHKDSSYRCMILKCVIPANKPYWSNIHFGEYASTSIKVVEAINPVDFNNEIK